MAEDSKRRLLIVEDDAGLQKQLKWCFEDHEVILAGNRAEALAELRRHEPPVVLQDLGLPPDDSGVSEGLATLAEVLALAPHTKVIVVTGNEDRDTAIRAVAHGAYDFYQKPVDTAVLRLIVQRAFRIFELEQQNRALQRAQQAPLAGIIATSEVMNRVCRSVEKVAPTQASVLLLGESGTGKEVLARALHSMSPRSSGRFVAINCAAIPETLLESELFGHEKGAFTGAVRQTPGKIEYAGAGTLFLDEIGDMPGALQAKLLRFLQERTIERVGGRVPIAVDVRVVCATNQDLATMIRNGRFREDLYYRISEVVVRIPPLRERGEDSLVIARLLLETRSREHARGPRRLTDDAVAAILAHTWPGNIRELENRINGAAIMADGKFITAADLGLGETDTQSRVLNLRVARQNAERQAIRGALAAANGNISRAAELLGITRPTLYDLMEKNELAAPQAREADAEE